MARPVTLNEDFQVICGRTRGSGELPAAKIFEETIHGTDARQRGIENCRAITNCILQKLKLGTIDDSQQRLPSHL
jgi:hypothetical protein